MTTYLTRGNNISDITTSISISATDIPSLSQGQKDTLAEFILVLAEVRRVTRQLEAEKKVPMSRAPKLLRELYGTLLIMAGDTTTINPDSINDLSISNGLDNTRDDGLSRALLTPSSSAAADKKRDDARGEHLNKTHAKELTRKLANGIKERLGAIWQPVHSTVAEWRPDDTEISNGAQQPDRNMHQPRRVLLFHIAALLDVNECALDCMDINTDEEIEYYKLLHTSVVREVEELNINSIVDTNYLLISLHALHKQMLQHLNLEGRKEPGAALL